MRGVLVVVPRRAGHHDAGRAGSEDLQYMATAAALALSYDQLRHAMKKHGLMERG